MTAAASAAAFGGKFDPTLFIPRHYLPRVEPEPPKSAEQIEDESQAGWSVIWRCFGRKKDGTGK